MIVISLKVDKELNDLIEQYAKSIGKTKSEIIRLALYQYLKQNKKIPYETKRIKIYT
jgi:predicted transcriptional regulator